MKRRSFLKGLLAGAVAAAVPGAVAAALPKPLSSFQLDEGSSSITISSGSPTITLPAHPNRGDLVTFVNSGDGAVTIKENPDELSFNRTAIVELPKHANVNIMYDKKHGWMIAGYSAG